MIPPSDPVIPPPETLPLAKAVPVRRESKYIAGAMSTKFVRGVLITIAILFSAVLGVSVWLNPYDADGTPRTMATHMQLGLPPCNFVLLSGKPCPSCGMTTSFALLAHGDVVNSLKANWVGTLLAAYWFALIPWAIASAIKGRALGVRSGEFLVTVSILGFMALAVGRWVFVLFR